MSTNIYVLKLEGNKYYIGKTDNIKKRIKAHFSGVGSVYTKKYKPIEHVKTYENVSPYLEDAITKEYMAEYGIDNVRGGSYVTLELTKEQKDFIQKEIWMTKNLCKNCGSSEHWVRECNKVEIVNKEEPKPAFINVLYNKIKNEFINSDSDLRSGRFFRKFF